ncbi:MAG: hypothetical protein PHY09_14475 [Desulfuromonadaceae bacterium]|nr:hypothetical protein [Desulfuromonadaceae bacterium]MDD5106268.1 hypothetical protein [Desulfuromonadaceae bacterium]
MSKPINDLSLEAIQRALSHYAGDAPDARAFAEVTIGTWQQMAAQLMPVIGTGGVNVLFNRSLHLTCIAFPWLTMLGDKRVNTALLASVKARLAGRDTDEAIHASCTLLVTFIEQLKTLIGESLTERLLDPIWVPTSPVTKQENTS